MSVTYITCFSEKMYAATGRKLIDSFYITKQQSELITYSEDSTWEELTFELDKNILHNFKEKNKDIIPKEFGGEHNGKCDCTEKKSNGQIKHIGGCPCSLWNRNMYRWFHKVVAIWQATDIDTDYLVWLDSDCYLKKAIPNTLIVSITEEDDMLYMRGDSREAIESGIIIFNFKKQGRELIQTWINYYKFDWFKKYLRWDDGYVLTRLVEEAKDAYWCKDMCAGSNSKAPATVSPLAEYIGHNKGTHVRDHKMF